MTLNIRIDRIVVEGMELTPGQRRQLKAGLETSLGKLFAEHGIPEDIASLRSMSKLPVEPIRIGDVDMQATQMGAQIAQSIYAGLRKQL